MWSKWRRVDINVHHHDAGLSEHVNGVRESLLLSLDLTCPWRRAGPGSDGGQLGSGWSSSSPS